ncbi:palmitoyl-protein thioesterase precursor [Patellaria atrata CBS 101060]|uniref:Palmitoyl-protein thioesterase 1 n=1 Tax=Patellaria atrata CBS 101060 TaxID=1346257 RepID=A0A9P4VPX7_9PEZI|nr:palmitoyl-protein thioesterase precursor [Patellaria atrata CBS 101060]
MRPPYFLLPILSLTSALPATSPSSSEVTLPLVIWHGLGDNYAADGLTDIARFAEETNPGTLVYIIRLGTDPSSDRTATFFGNLTLQISQVCADLATHQILSTAPAVNALGFSQGGQFLRAYVERCNVPPVRNLVTFGSQHNGIARYENCGPTDWVCKGAFALLRGNTWSAFVQSRLVPAQYYRTVEEYTGLPTKEYLEHSNFLADMNNEREVKNETYAENIARLNRFVMYLFEEDTTVVPKESGWFAEVNGTTGDVLPLRNRTIYTEDWLGLKRLDEKGGLIFETTEGGHMSLSDELLENVFRDHFGPVKMVEVLSGDKRLLQGTGQEVMEL